MDTVTAREYTYLFRVKDPSTMSFGFGSGVGDIIAISQLAVKVYTAYKDAPNEYNNIAEEIKSLGSIIN